MTARQQRNRLLACWVALALPLSTPARAALPAPGKTPPPAETRAERVVAGLHAWQETLRQQLAELPAKALAAREPELPAPDVVLDEIAAQLAEWRATWTRIDAWEAERREPAGRAAELVAEAHACGEERRYQRDLRTKLAALNEALGRWERAARRHTAEDLQRLAAVLQSIGTTDELTEAHELLVAWAAETSAQTAPPPAPGADAAGKLRGQLADQLAKLLREPAPPVPGNAAMDGGRVERMVAESNARPAEQRRRQDLQKSMQSLARDTESWLLAERGRSLARSHRLAQLASESLVEAPKPRKDEETGTETGPVAGVYRNPEDYEYYELKQPSTLKEVSAMPVIYGDPDQWRRLLQANPGAAASATAKLPTGTLLVVPRSKPDHE